MKNVLEEEWGEWECPTCGSVQSDPESITVTSCANGHTCILGAVESGVVSIGNPKSSRWAERYKWDEAKKESPVRPVVAG